MDPGSFARDLITRPSGAPHSVQLEIDTGGDQQAMFEVLLIIMTEMMKQWYAPPISIGTVQEADIARLTAYYASFGIKFKLDIVNAPATLSIRNRDYIQQSRLENMKFQVAHASKLYTVRFSNLPTA
jgi:hypothetical protein